MNLNYLPTLILAAAFMCTVPCRSDSLVSPPARPQALSAGAAADCHDPGVSADGRFVVFVSAAGNLVTNDHNGAFDVFVRDRQQGRTILVSINAAGTQSGNGASGSPTISASGQFVVFESTASDLVEGDNNNAADVFVRDLVAGTTTLVSVNAAGTAPGNLESKAPTMTPDGRFVLFSSRASNLSTGDSNNAVDLFVRDLVLGTTKQVTRNYFNSGSFAGLSAAWDGRHQISDDGRWVAFDSAAANLVQNDVNGKSDVFVRDLLNGTNLALSVNTAGTALGNGNSQSISMDASGHYVAFQSAASNLSPYDTNVNGDVFRRNVAARTTRLASVNTNGIASGSGNSFSPVLSKQGNVVVFLSTANDLTSGDTNVSGADLFRRDFDADTTSLIASKVSPSGDRFVPAVSADGRFVLYQDAASNLVLFDALGSARVVISSNTPAADAVMTDDALFIAFIGAPEITGARNIYLRDRLAGTTELVSPREPALPVLTGSAASRLFPGGVSSNGQVVVFESYAGDLAPGDTNRTCDVWSCDLGAGPGGSVRLSSVIDGFARGPSRRPVLSGDGHWVAFEAIPDITTNAGLATRFNLYAFDRAAQTNVLIGGVGSVVTPSQAAFSEQGALLVFRSSQSGVGGYATMVGQIYYRDLSQDTNRLVTLNYLGTAPADGPSFEPVISPDGRYVAYLSAAPGLWTNSVAGPNAFLWDSTTGSNLLVSAFEDGVGINQVSKVAFHARGALLSFQQGATNYLYDIARLSIVATNLDAANVSLSADGNLVACERDGSYSAGDTNGTTDIYVMDRSTGLASLVSVNRNGTGSGNGKSMSPRLTPDGRYVLFRSRASDLVRNDHNGVSDVFLRDLVLNKTILLSLSGDGSEAGNGLSGDASMSADGSTVFFGSYASDLADGDYNAARDLLVLRLSRGDSDGDGLPDDWELAYFNTLERDGTGDYDGDGQSDRSEFLAGTDPTNAGSVLRVITLSPAASGPVRVFWSAVPGKTYRVQFKTSPVDSAWTDLAGDVVAADTTGFKDDATGGADNQRYYRVRLVP